MPHSGSRVEGRGSRIVEGRRGLLTSDVLIFLARAQTIYAISPLFLEWGIKDIQILSFQILTLGDRYE